MNFQLTKIKKIILGLDLGISNLGYAVLVSDGIIKNYIVYNCFFTSKFISTSERILKIYLFLEQLLITYSPNLVCIEKVFHTNNTKTFSVINQVHGAILALLASKKLLLLEITPIQVKLYNGLKSNCKKQEIIIRMKSVFKIKNNNYKKNDDAFDALAISNTFFYLFT